MSQVLAENKFGHGGLPSTVDIRDHKYHRIGMAPVPFDWNAGFDIEKKGNQSLPTENQYSSSSCGGQAVRYYMEILKFLDTKMFERLSAHDPYCQFFYPGGGTTIRDIAKLAVQVGIKSESVVSSYLNGDCPESFMEDKSLSQASPTAVKFKEFAFAFPKTDIETVASAIRDNNGAILQVTGYNNGTWLSTYPQPTPTGARWSHFLYAGKAKVMNGTKYIGVKNSWGDVGDAGWQWLPESYFQGGVTNALVFYDNSLYSYNPTVLQQTPTWLQKFLNFFLNYFTS